MIHMHWTDTGTDVLSRRIVNHGQVDRLSLF